MSRCEKCQYPFSDGEPPPSFCPRCGTERSVGQGEGQWVSIARLSDLAEVGYFADVLESDGIATRVRQHDEFSAVDGSWKSIFILQVTPDCSSKAARQLREVLDRTSDDPQEVGAEGAVVDRLSLDDPSDAGTTALWKPVVLILIAGSLFYTTRSVNRADRKHPPSSSALWDALTESDRVLSTGTAPGQPGSRLLIDRRSRTVLLQEDFNGDGRSDRTRCFRDGELVGDSNR
jgi:hypothetical protein